MRDLPRTPEALLDELFAIFPEYRTTYGGPIHDETPTFHSVLIGFTPSCDILTASCTEKQLRAFGDLVNAAAETGGDIENAFGTCLLEHLHQIRALKVFRPYLSQNARKRLHA
jgi:hypothetical protein